MNAAKCARQRHDGINNWLKLATDKTEWRKNRLMLNSPQSIQINRILLFIQVSDYAFTTYTNKANGAPSVH